MFSFVFSDNASLIINWKDIEQNTYVFFFGCQTTRRSWSSLRTLEDNCRSTQTGQRHSGEYFYWVVHWYQHRKSCLKIHGTFSLDQEQGCVLRQEMGEADPREHHGTRAAQPYDLWGHPPELSWWLYSSSSTKEKLAGGPICRSLRPKEQLFETLWDHFPIRGTPQNCPTTTTAIIILTPSL